MNRQERIRENLFNIFSENLNNVIQNSNLKISLDKPTFICPLCLRYFDKNSLKLNASNYLTLEHVPPRKVGGKTLVLLCKECNNTTGKNYDVEIKNKLNIDNLFQPRTEYKLPIKFQTGEFRPFSAKIEMPDKDKLIINSIEKHIHPKANEEIKDMFNSNKGSFKISFNLPNEDNLRFAYLKIAYLLLFNKFGYGFVFSSNAQYIRKSIFTAGIANIERIPIFNLSSIGLIGINVITEPKINAYFVGFEVFHKEVTKRIGIFIPGENQTIDEFYEKIEQIKKINTITINYVKVDEKNFLSESRCLDAFKNWYV